MTDEVMSNKFVWRVCGFDIFIWRYRDFSVFALMSEFITTGNKERRKEVIVNKTREVKSSCGKFKISVLELSLQN